MPRTLVTTERPKLSARDGLAGTIHAMTTREKLHRLVDELADAELAPTLRIVEMQRHDAVIRAFANAPGVDEPWTADDEAAVEQSDADFAAGNTLSHEEMLRRYG